MEFTIVVIGQPPYDAQIGMLDLSCFASWKKMPWEGEGWFSEHDIGQLRESPYTAHDAWAANTPIDQTRDWQVRCQTSLPWNQSRTTTGTVSFAN